MAVDLWKAALAGAFPQDHSPDDGDDKISILFLFSELQTRSCTRRFNICVGDGFMLEGKGRNKTRRRRR